MCGEKNSETICEFQMGIEPTTFRTLVGRSNHWVTVNFSDEQVWHNDRISQSHNVKWTHKKVHRAVT